MPPNRVFALVLPERLYDVSRRTLTLGLVCLAGLGVVLGVALAMHVGKGSCASGRDTPCSAVAALVPAGDSNGATTAKATDGSTTTSHYATNVRGNVGLAAALGFNLLDVGGKTTHPARVRAAIAALPPGAKALVWVGNLDNSPVSSSCPPPGFTNRQFAAQVKALAHNPRVFGYYIADEPHPSNCPSAANDIKARADYIHLHAPGQYAFIVVLDGEAMCGNDLGCEYRALQPALTNVDYFGLDPYPCHYDSAGNKIPCDVGMITARVNAAESNGIPVDTIVPVFQVFGQQGRTGGASQYYRLPSARELTAMLATWVSQVPHPTFDYSYTFGIQCTALTCPAPQALASEPSLQVVMSTHNAGS